METGGPVWYEPTELWFDHQTLTRADLPRLATVHGLTLRAVRLEDPSMLAELPKLWWLDWRGGTDTKLDWIGRLRTLVYVQVWHAYKLETVDFLAELPELQGFMLHATSRVPRLPSFARSPRLHSVWLSSMKALRDVSGLASAPALRQLILQGPLALAPADLSPLKQCPTLETFRWTSERSVRRSIEGEQLLGLRRAEPNRERWPFSGLSPEQLEAFERRRGAVERR